MHSPIRVRVFGRAAFASSLIVAVCGTASAAAPALVLPRVAAPVAAQVPAPLHPMADGPTPEHILFAFDGADGNVPNAGFIADEQGNLFSTTSYNGGTHQFGNVYELTRSGSAWKELDLHDFDGTDGAYPLDTPIFDTHGNLFGVAQVGGQGSCTNNQPPLGCGVAFELTKVAGGWKETVLYDFVPGKSKGVIPVGGLVADGAGNLYGTTWAPGITGNPLLARARVKGSASYWGCTEPGCGGTVFELSPTKNGWHETDLYAFKGGADGSASVGSLIMDAAGNLYGTTNYGGVAGCASNYGCGVVFELEHRTNGWHERVLHAFTGGKDGAYPMGNVIADRAGNLYGTASSGGAYNNGVVYELSRAGNRWAEHVLYAFTGGSDGGSPMSAVIANARGELFGTTYSGGSGSPPSGVAFALRPQAGGAWKERVLHSFTHDGVDGQAPRAPLFLGPDELLYGTTESGGAHNNGTVFSVAP